MIPDALYAAEIPASVHTVTLAAPPSEGLDSGGLADWLRGFFGPLFLAIVSVVAIFFLFTREVTKFFQFAILAIFIGIVFYVPNVIEVTAKAIATALGVPTEGGS